MNRAVGVAPTEISASSTPASRSLVAMDPSDLGLPAGDRLELLLRCRAVSLARVAQQPEKPQARELADAADVVDDRRRIGIDAAAMKPDVNFHEHVELPLRGDHRRRPRRRHVAVVHDDRQPHAAIEQRDDARGVGGIDRIGQPDVANAGLGKHFSLAKLRAAHANRTGIELHLRDDRALVCLRVRPQTHARARREGLHRGDVVLKTRTIDENSGSWDGEKIHVGVPKGSSGFLGFPRVQREVVTLAREPPRTEPFGTPWNPFGTSRNLYVLRNPNCPGYLNPGKIVETSRAPRWPETRSANTLRKSVVIARSRPSQR